MADLKKFGDGPFTAKEADLTREEAEGLVEAGDLIRAGKGRYRLAFAFPSLPIEPEKAAEPAPTPSAPPEGPRYRDEILDPGVVPDEFLDVTCDKDLIYYHQRDGSIIRGRRS